MPEIDLRAAARDHLWLHFTRMHGYERAGDRARRGLLPLRTTSGKRYLDALAGLFAVNIGYSYGDEIGQAAHEQMRELPFYTNWSYAHPRAIELAAELAELAPGDLNRAFFVSGGSEAVESAWKLARAVPHGARRAPLEGGRAPHRLPRHDDGRALDQRRPGAAHAVRAARAGRRRTCATRTATTVRPTRPRREFTRVPARRPRGAIVQAGPGDGRDGDHGAGPERGRLVHAAGRLLPGRARDLRPLRDPALRRRGDHRLRPHRRRGSRARSTTSGPT